MSDAGLRAVAEAAMAVTALAAALDFDGWDVDLPTEIVQHFAAFDPPTALALLDRVEAAEAAIDRIRRRHPRGDEESNVLAPGLWCPTCGMERADNGYGGCRDRAALGTAGHGDPPGTRLGLTGRPGGEA